MSDAFNVSLDFDSRAIARMMNDQGGDVGRYLVRTLEQFKQAAQAEAPVKTGNLRDRHVKRIGTVGGELTGVVGVINVPYAMWVHEGTKPHPIRPVRAPFLVFEARDGTLVFTKHVNHPGTQPNRWLIRAANTVYGQSHVREVTDRPNRV